MSAPFPADPLVVARALLLFPKFGLFTTICPPPKSSDAGRFSDAMMADSNYYQLIVGDGEDLESCAACGLEADAKKESPVQLSF